MIMNCIIYKDENKKVTRQFIKHLLNIIFIYGKSYLYNDMKRVSKINKYLHETIPEYKSNTVHVILQGLSHIKIEEYGSYYRLRVDENLMIPGTIIRVYDICNLVNDGNLEVQGISIFDKSFEYIRDNIKTLYALYAVNTKLRN